MSGVQLLLPFHMLLPYLQQGRRQKKSFLFKFYICKIIPYLSLLNAIFQTYIIYCNKFNQPKSFHILNIAKNFLYVFRHPTYISFSDLGVERWALVVVCNWSAYFPTRHTESFVSCFMLLASIFLGSMLTIKKHFKALPTPSDSMRGSGSKSRRGIKSKQGGSARYKTWCACHC